MTCLTPRYFRVWAMLSLAVSLVAPSGLRAAEQDPVLHALDLVELEQRLGERIPLDLHFTDDTGSTGPLAGWFRGEPTVIVMAYYRCPMLCGLVLNGLVDALREVPLDAGQDFHVVVVSIDPRETPEDAAEAKATLLRRYDRAGAAAGWHLLTGEEREIQALAAAVGFHYAYDELTDQYAHPSGVMVAAPNGTLTQYFYGFDYSPRELGEAFAKAEAGEVGSRVHAILMSCFLYDPVTGRFGLTILTALRLGGVLTVVALGSYIGYRLRVERRGRVLVQAE